MTLSFQTKWPERMGELAGQPNYFPEKIWSGLKFDNPREWSILHSCYMREYKLKIGEEWDNEYKNICRAYPPKLHTIRRDEHDRWKPGRDIHFVINNRTKNYCQFAPAIEVKSVQKIEIKHLSITQYPVDLKPMIWIDTIPFYDPAMGLDKGMLALALNDGFPSVEAFFQYFNEGYTGKIIHFTDLKY